MPIFTFTDQNGGFSCHWEWSSTYGPDADFRVLILTIREGFDDIAQGGGGADKSLVSSSEDKRGVLKFLAEMHRKHNAVSAGDTVAKLLVLNRHGYIIRSDALVSPAVEIARGSIHQSFMVPQEHFDSIPSRKHEDDTTGNAKILPGLRGEPLELDACSQPQLDFLKILKNVTDAFVVRPVITSKHTSTTVVQPVLDEDLANSLCVPPTLSSGMAHNRLVIAGTRNPTEMDTILRSAYALGIRVTMMGQGEDSGIRTKEYAALEGYIDILLEPWEETVSDAIVRLMSSNGPYHGIITFEHLWGTAVAKAARILGLRYMMPPLVHDRLILKDIMRLCNQGPSDPLRLEVGGVGGVGGDMNDEEVAKRVGRYLETPGLVPKFPVVVEPNMINYFQDHRLATDTRELVQAIAFLQNYGVLLIDRYEEGPDVGVTIVLKDGEILVFDLFDYFPAKGEQFLCNNEKCEYSHLPKGDLMKTDVAWPSMLPQKEQDLVRDAVHKMLLFLGARDGVLFICAKIRNSSVHYAPVQQRGVGEDEVGAKTNLVDLVPKPIAPTEEPSVHILEVYPHPPLECEYWASKIAYGIDYYALYMLYALGEDERFLANARPFSNLARVTSLCVVYMAITVQAWYQYSTTDFYSVLQQKRPDLANHVYHHARFLDSSDGSLDRTVGMFIVTAGSRTRALEIAKEIRETLPVETTMYTPLPRFITLETV